MQGLGEKNSNWKGDDVTYVSLHKWIRRNKPRPDLCECCKKSHPYDVANISQEYKRDVNDFEWLCRVCHMKKDGRLLNFKDGTKCIRPRGEKNGASKLNEYQVRVIKHMKKYMCKGKGNSKKNKGFITLKQVGLIFGISKAVVYVIQNDKGWKHIKI